MAIFLNEDSRIIVQGMTGAEGRKHTVRMLAAGSRIVGGVTPGKAGQTVELGSRALPVFGSVAEAMVATGADVTVVFVPPRFAKAAVVEAVDAGHDTASFWAHACATGNKTRIVGPNCPGVISPGRSNAGR